MNTGSVLDPAGPVARTLAEVAWVLIGGAAAIFAIVMVLLAWTLMRRRPEPADRQPIDHRHARRWIIAGGLMFPGTVLAALLVYAALRTSELQPPRSAGEPVISVTAHMWWWQVRHRSDESGAAFTLANEIHLPAGRAVTIGLSSGDVIHSLWVPALAGKVDMLPGRVHQLRLQADRPGVYRGQCAEFCGEQHTRMGLRVVVHEAADYTRWLAAQARPAALPNEPQALRGMQVFREQRCGACHTVRGLGAAGTAAASGTIGPDLTHLGSRLTLGAGALPMNHASLAAWVADSQAAKPGVRMPSYPGLDPEALGALAGFLEQLK